MHKHHISSPQNPLVKWVVSLEKAAERRKNGIFVIEGLRECAMAAAGGYTFSHLIWCEEFTTEQSVKAHLPKQIIGEAELITMGADAFRKIAYREEAENIVGIAHIRQHDLDRLPVHPRALYVVIEGVEKPGNLGAMLRTTDAAGISGMIICEPATDLYNPNVIRASIGGIFTQPIAITDSATAIAWLKQQQVKIFTTWLEAAVPYSTADYSSSCAIVMGAEAQGISSIWVEAADQNIIIPMKGKVDSLNVSVSCAIVLFEAMRQRSHSI